MSILAQIAITVLKEDRIMQKNVYSNLANNAILLSDVIGPSQATEGEIIYTGTEEVSWSVRELRHD